MVYGDSLPQRSQRTQGLCDLGGSQYLIAEAMCRILRSLDLFGTHSGATRRPFFSCCLWMILKNLVNEASGRRGGARRFALGMPSAVRGARLRASRTARRRGPKRSLRPHPTSFFRPLTHPSCSIHPPIHFPPSFLRLSYSFSLASLILVTGRLINYTYCFGNQIL